ncbi:hypothetical protein N7468_008346 [Penicillium chermesinum]|uniref:INO80 complex subunit F domain-containing protein n=1 Tax=Penicillium chermesinum TaxID=63820 RepID=A0A9W9TIK0_9EURO|nr:uncharacterized protein N7468_008346 [Penicillium chermesinum]KAJ5223804.1 hypothetical protein N7468_008346 [Penicillium chermesinum]
MEAQPPNPAPPSANPPSVEIAYKRKCISLKRRLTEVEAENEIMRTRNRRGWQYIKKMRLESCILLERLAAVTAMVDEAQAGNIGPELRARALALAQNSSLANGTGGTAGAGYLEDETEGSSEEQPPTPEDRPLRVKRSRKSNLNIDGAEEDGPAYDNAAEPAEHDAGSSSLPRLAPAPSQHELSASFRVGTGSHEGDRTPHSQDQREGQPEHAADSGTTPMDMDAKEPKVEGA